MIVFPSDQNAESRLAEWRRYRENLLERVRQIEALIHDRRQQSYLALVRREPFDPTELNRLESDRDRLLCWIKSRFDPSVDEAERALAGVKRQQEHSPRGPGR
jgi:hypothetical protein